MLVGIATNLCLESVEMPSSLILSLGTLQFCEASPVLLMKVARAGLTMVTFLSWMVNARTSSFIGRTLGREQDHYVPLGQTACFLLSCKAGVACCLPTWRNAVMNTVNGVFWAFWFLLGVLCIWGVLVFLGSLLCTRLGLLRCASCWTRPLGGGRWGHYHCNLWREYLKVHKTAYKYLGIYVGFYDVGAIYASLSGTAQSPWL